MLTEWPESLCAFAGRGRKVSHDGWHAGLDALRANPRILVEPSRKGGSSARSEDCNVTQVILGPDIYVNASVALGSAPEQVARRVLRDKSAGATTEWILTRVRQMLARVPGFKDDAVDAQLELIRGLVQIVSESQQHSPEAWEEALVSAAKLAGVSRVITDHPDLLKKESSDGIEFISSEAWLLEAATPPPPPSTRH